MFRTSLKVDLLSVALTCLIGWVRMIASAQQTKHPFTVADEIGLALFNIKRRATRIAILAGWKLFRRQVPNAGDWTLIVSRTLFVFIAAKTSSIFLAIPMSRSMSPVWTIARARQGRRRHWGMAVARRFQRDRFSGTPRKRQSSACCGRSSKENSRATDFRNGGS